MFKACIVNDQGRPAAFVLFSGSVAQEQPTSPFFPSAFTTSEAALIAGGCPVIESAYQVYPDESIRSIKQKIIWAVHADNVRESEKPERTRRPNTRNTESFLVKVCDEIEVDGTAAIYLFGAVPAPFSFLEFYREITQQDSRPMTQGMMSAFLANYKTTAEEVAAVDAIKNSAEYLSSDTFQYEQWSDHAWFLPGTTKLRMTPLGLRFVHHHISDRTELLNNTGVFPVDPGEIATDNASKVYHPSQSEVLTSANYEFLLSYGEVADRTFYVYTADTVTSLWAGRGVTGIGALVLHYFPLLKRTFDAQPVATDNTAITTGTAATRVAPTIADQNIETVLTFLHSVSKGGAPTPSEAEAVDTTVEPDADPAAPTDAVVLKQSAILQFTAHIVPDKTGGKFPLESVFKNVHATLDVPFIQYNPGLKRDKMYRLYSESIAQNGQAIPFVDEHTVLEFKKHSGKMVNITFYVWMTRNGQTRLERQGMKLGRPAAFNTSEFMRITMLESGTLMIHTEDMVSPVPEETFTSWFQERIATVITQLNDFFGQSGFAIRDNIALTDAHVTIVSLKYTSTFALSSFVNVTQAMPLMTPIFYEDAGDVPADIANRQRGQTNARLNVQEVDVFRRYKRVEGFKKPNPFHQFIASALVLTTDLATIRLQLKQQFPDQTDAQLRAHMQEFNTDQLANNASGKTIVRKLSTKTGFLTHFHKSKYESQWTVVVSQITSYAYLSRIRQYLTAMFTALQTPSMVPAALSVLLLPGPAAAAAAANQSQNVLVANQVTATQLEADTDAGEVQEQEAEMAANEAEPEEDEEGEVPDLGFMYEEEEESGSDEEREDGEGAVGGDALGGKGTRGGAPSANNISQYFLTRITSHDPRMNTNGYARMCAANIKRQPVVISESEKNKIDAISKRTKTKPYTHALQYGTSALTNEKLFYICPKYWCTKAGEERPLTEAEAKSGVCGKIIQDPANIKDGEYAFQVGDSKDRYREPGFVNTKSTKDVCVPCCFGKWDNKTQEQMRTTCNPSVYAPTAAATGKKKPQLTVYDYLPLLNTTPLNHGRIGFLPTAVHFFLHTGPREQMVTAQNYPILGRPLLLKYGVVQPGYTHQSFLGCIADVYVYQQSRKQANVPYPTIPEIRSILADAVDLDLFIRINNASLVALFRPTTLDIPAADTAVYAHTEFVKRLDFAIRSHRQLFDSTVAAFLVFKAYLVRPDIVLDATYLWEIVSRPNAKLLPDGINLAILDVPAADITDNVNLLCPPSSYFLPAFDPERETLLLVRQMESGVTNNNDPTPKLVVYEPVYLYEIYDQQGMNHVRIRKTFRIPEGAGGKYGQDTTTGVNALTGVQAVIRLIGVLANKKCGRASTADPMLTNNRANVVLSKLRDVPELKVLHQISNFQNMCVGFAVSCQVSEPASKYFSRPQVVYVPTAPSALLTAGDSTSTDALTPVMMDAAILRRPFDTTVDLLRYISGKSRGAVMCAPHTKVVDEHKMLVGVITITNQFISVKPEGYVAAPDDGLKVLDGSNYCLRDMDLQINKSVPPKSNGASGEEEGEGEGEGEDTAHIAYVRNSQLEAQFYSAFRNTVRVLINLYLHRQVRQNLRVLVNDIQTPYRQKRAAVEAIVRALVRGSIEFHEYGPIAVRDIYTCTGKGAASKPYCAARTDGEVGYKLLLPKKNLVSPSKKNEGVYFIRLADELLRNRGVQSMLRPGNMQLTGSTTPVVFDDEILLIGSNLTAEYFSDLAPFPKSIHTTTYSTARTGERVEPALQWPDLISAQE